MKDTTSLKFSLTALARALVALCSVPTEMTRSSGRTAALAAKSKIVTVVEPEDEKEPLQKRKRERQEESDFEDSEEEAMDSNEDPIHSTNPVMTSDGVRTGKKKKLTYMPPLSHSWLKGSVCGSFETMKRAMDAHNSVTKRANRRFMTKLYKDESRDGRVVIDESLLCKLEETNSKATTCLVKVTSKTEVEFKTNFLSGMPNAFWCDCEICLTGPTQLLLLVRPEQGLHAIRFQIDSSKGFIGDEFSPEQSYCRVPFKIACACLKDGYLCLGSNEAGEVAKVFILSTGLLHASSGNFSMCSLTAAITLPSSELTALSLGDLGLLSGTTMGRVRLHSLPHLKESLQLALPSAVPVYTLAAVGKEKLVVTGRMSKVLSYSLLEGGDWLIEASNLPIIPRFIASGEGLVYADVESHARLIISTVYHSPLSATFDSMITGMDASSMHSIVALGSAKGAVYLSWLQGLVKRIAPAPLLYWKGIDKESFVPFKTEETLVKWSQSRSSPGLLAIIQEDSVRLIICDQFIT